MPPSEPRMYLDDLNAVREYVEAQRGRRPTPKEVAKETGVEPGFLGMVRGINEGISFAQVKNSRSKSRTQRKEMKRLQEESARQDAKDIAACLIEDDPRSILNQTSLRKSVREFIDAPPPNDKTIHAVVKDALEEAKRVFSVGGKRGNLIGPELEHRERLKLMKLNFSKLYFKEHSGEIAITGLQNSAERLFGSKIPKLLIDEVREWWASTIPVAEAQEPVKTPEPTPEPVKAIKPEPEPVRVKKTPVKEPEKVRLPTPKKALVLEQAHLLGGAKDADVAATLGVSRETVRRVRKELGIEPWVEGASVPETPSSGLPKAPLAQDPSIQDSAPAEPKTPEQMPPTWVNAHTRMPPKPVDLQNVSFLGAEHVPDKAAEIGNAVAQLIRLGCVVNFTITTPQSVNLPLEEAVTKLNEA